MAVDGVPGYLRFRIVNRITGVDIVTDLKHPHTSTWTVKGMQQGAPGSSAIGSFNIPLFPPGSEEYERYWADYSKLLPGSGEGYRVEAYRGDLGTGSAPWQAGIILAVNWDNANGIFELTGSTDVWVAQAQTFWPQEVTSNAVGTANAVDRFTRYLGENILSFSDQFSPYVAGNYNVVAAGGRTVPVFSASTDANGVNPNVISTQGADATSSGGYLISKTGISAAADADHLVIVECLLRTKSLVPLLGTDTFLSVGVGLSTSNVAIAGGTSNGTSPATAPALFQYDPDGYAFLQLQMLISASFSALVVNGQLVGSVGAGIDVGAGTVYPFFEFFDGSAVAGNPYSQVWFTNLMVGTRNTAKVNTTTAPFIAGTTDSPTKSQTGLVAQSQTFLDAWTGLANLQNWSWRYTPVSMVAGSHPTMGKVDFGAQPGTDRSASVRFVSGDNLVSLREQGNADNVASDLTFNGNPANNSGGTFYARNLSAMATYGWLTDISSSMTVTEFNGFRGQANSVILNKVAPGSSITATVLRDPATADVWRELDYVSVDEPLLNLRNKKLLVLAYTFTEGQTTQQLTLGQYGTDIMGVQVTASRIMPAVSYLAGSFKHR